MLSENQFNMWIIHTWAMLDTIQCTAKCEQYTECCNEDCIISMFCVE